MSDLNGTNFNFNPVSGKNIQQKPVEQAKPCSDCAPEDSVNDITTNHAEIIGRSMITNDSLKNDLDAFIENPQIGENSDKLFEFAYVQATDDGLENAYEEAAYFSTTQL